MKKQLSDADALAPVIQLLIDMKDLLGGNVPPWSGLLFLMVYTQPGVSQQELAAQSGLSKFAVSRVVRAYEERGMIDAERNGRDKKLTLSKAGKAIGQTLAARCRAKLRRVALALL